MAAPYSQINFKDWDLYYTADVVFREDFILELWAKKEFPRTWAYWAMKIDGLHFGLDQNAPALPPDGFWQEYVDAAFENWNAFGGV